jgi:hypothetical protein
VRLPDALAGDPLVRMPVQRPDELAAVGENRGFLARPELV